MSAVKTSMVRVSGRVKALSAAWAKSAQSRDPYFLWYFATHPKETRRVPIAIEFVRDSKWEDDTLLNKEVPAHYHKDQFGTARVVAHDLETLFGKKYNKFIRRIRLGRAWYAPDASSPLTDWRTAPPPTPLHGHVIAVIDDGCAFAHERFRFKDHNGRWRTRIQYLWDQGRIDGKGWHKVEDFGYGHDLRANDIDALLAVRTSSGGVVDEDGVYADANYVRMKSLEVHGTHVLDVAAGAPPDGPSGADEPSIVFVQLPRNAVVDTSGGWMNASVMDALWYVHSRVAPDAKLVINLSFGAMAGPHDGSSILESAIDHFCEIRSTDFAIVIPAGNAFETGCHAAVTLKKGEEKSLTWRVRPDDPTDTFFELWYDRRANVEIKLISPDPRVYTRFLAPDDDHVVFDANKHVQCALVHLEDGGNGKDSRAVAMLAPSDPQDRTIGAAPAGDWSVVIRNTGTAPVQVDAWIERDDPVAGTQYPSQRQARFLAHEPATGPCNPGPPLCHEGTLNSIAHGERPIVVGGCVGGEVLTMSRYSGSGPSRGGKGRKGPDVVALSDESSTVPGILAAGTRSGHLFRLTGTSVAAPQVARWIMRHLASSRLPQTEADIRIALASEARVNPVVDPCSLGVARTGEGCVKPLP